MQWKYFIPHPWDGSTTETEDLWLWPVKTRIQGNMEDKINLTVNCTGNLIECDDAVAAGLARRLQAEEGEYWIWPYPDIEWGDDASMIVRGDEFSEPELLEYARIYLEHRGFKVEDFIEASREEAFEDPARDGSG